MTNTEHRKIVAEHYRRVSHGLEGIKSVYSALEKLDTDVRKEYDSIFLYLYKYNTRSVVSASLNFNMSTASVYRRLSKLCRLIDGETKIHAKIKRSEKGENTERFIKKR